MQSSVTLPVTGEISVFLRSPNVDPMPNELPKSYLQSLACI